MSLIGQLGQKAMALPGVKYDIVGGQLVPITDNASNYIQEGYNANDIIYSVVNLISEKIKMAPWAVYKVKDESSLKRLKGILGKKNLNGEDYRVMKDLRHKALELDMNAGPWGELVKYPNDYDSFPDFVAYACGYKMLTGNGFVRANLLTGGAEGGLPMNLWVMPSQNVVIKAKEQWPPRVVGYQLNLLEVKDYPLEEVMHFKYPNYTSGRLDSMLWGMAPLKAACLLTNQLNSADKSATAKYQNGGLQHIIFVKEQGLTSADRGQALIQMQELKKKLATEYTGPLNTGKIAATSFEVGVQNLGLSPADLQIIEAQKWGLRRICNVFGGIASQSLNDPENKSYNNAKEGEVILTTRGALPNMLSFREGFNRAAHQYWKLDKNKVIDFDQTVYTELQEDVSDLAAWVLPMAKATGISANRVLDLMGQETIDDPYYDLPRVHPEMGQTLEEYSLNDVDNILNGEAGNTNSGQGGES